MSVFCEILFLVGILLSNIERGVQSISLYRMHRAQVKPRQHRQGLMRTFQLLPISFLSRHLRCCRQLGSETVDFPLSLSCK